MRKRKKRLLACRGLRSDVRQQGYAQICDGDPNPRPAHAGGPKALTVSEHIEKQRRKACKIFKGLGETCERSTCLQPRAKHPKVWVQT